MCLRRSSSSGLLHGQVAVQVGPGCLLDSGLNHVDGLRLEQIGKVGIHQPLAAVHEVGGQGHPINQPHHDLERDLDWQVFAAAQAPIAQQNRRVARVQEDRRGRGSHVDIAQRWFRS